MGRFKRGDQRDHGLLILRSLHHVRGRSNSALRDSRKPTMALVPFGNLNGTRTETMVMPYADGHAMKVPHEISDGAALTLSCNLPTAVIANHLADIRVGEKCLALVGCGPTGLMALDIALPGAWTNRFVGYRTHRLAAAAKRLAIDSSQDGWKKRCSIRVAVASTR